MDSAACVWDVQPFVSGERLKKTFQGASMGPEKNLIKVSCVCVCVCVCLSPPLLPPLSVLCCVWPPKSALICCSSSWSCTVRMDTGWKAHWLWLWRPQRVRVECILTKARILPAWTQGLCKPSRLSSRGANWCVYARVYIGVCNCLSVRACVWLPACFPVLIFLPASLADFFLFWVPTP